MDAPSGEGGDEAPSSSSTPDPPPPPPPPPSINPQPLQQQPPPSRYESQKRRDWNTFLQYLKNHKPPLTLPRCSGAHVIEFLKYLDQFGKTKVHVDGCPHFGHPNPPSPCTCPLRQAWGSLDALIGRLRAAYEENGGKPEDNPFGTRPVRIYLREVRESQAKARGIPYEKKKRKRLPPVTPATVSASGGGGGEEGEGSSAAIITVATTTTPPPPIVTSSSAGENSSALPPPSKKEEEEEEEETTTTTTTTKEETPAAAQAAS